MRCYLLEIIEYDIIQLTGTCIYILQVLLITATDAGKIMRCFLCISVRSVVTVVRGNQLQTVINLYGICIVDYIYALADIGGRYTISGTIAIGAPPKK